MTGDEIDEVIAGSSPAHGAPGTPASTASRSSPPTTRSSISSGRHGPTGGPTRGAARSRRGCASRARCSKDPGRCGDDFIVGLAVSVDTRSEPALTVDQLAEIVAWHDERRLMDYVTCGTGSYFDFFPIIPVSLYEQQLGVPFAAALKRVVSNAVVQARAISGRRPRPRRSSLPGRPTWSASSVADRRPVSGRQGAPTRADDAPVHLVQPAVLGASVARLLDLVPRQRLGRPRVAGG